MNVSWLLQRRSFLLCAAGCGNALRYVRAAHAGQDDRVARWAGGVGNTNKFILHNTDCLRKISSFTFS